MSLEICRAECGDATQIQAIAESLRLRSPPQKNGFLVNVLDEGGYKARMCSPYFFVAKQRDEVRGFIMGYDRETLQGLVDSGEIDGRKAIPNAMLKRRRVFVWGDQIGIKLGLNRMGIGNTLLRKVFQEMRGNYDSSLFYAPVLKRPAKNRASIAFCESHGLIPVKNISEEGRQWIIYGREIKK